MPDHQSLNSGLPGVEDVASELREALGQFKHRLSWQDIGRVRSVLPGVAYIEGLDTVGAEELVLFENGSTGIAFDISEKGVATLLLSDSAPLKSGMEAASTGKLVRIPVGDELLGRVVNPLGEPLDGKGFINASRLSAIEGEIPQILDRASVQEPLETGIKVLDALIPIGKGQRELILGDRQTGKTAIAIDTIINQKGKDVLCVYCAIGQCSSSVASVISTLEKHGCMDFSVVMVAEGNDSPGLRYIAPYAATAVAEYFMHRGQDVLVVYDDLTNHARTYREISLLMRRPPGREAFPGDIFYIHSRLLERSTHLNSKNGGGSLTAIPIIETQEQDISAYIPTNLISITDGQIYLSSSLFQKSILPAVDIGRSVSRVGGKAQLPVFRQMTRDLKLAYAQFEELESFSRFGTRIDPATKRVLEHGKRIRHCLTQSRFEPISAREQILVLLALQEGLFDRLPLDKLEEAERLCRSLADELPGAARLKLVSKSVLGDDDLTEIRRLLRKRFSVFLDEQEEDG